METKISIIVPVYNCKEYVERCISSLLEQTYKNLEIILVNDGSTDGVEEILDRYLDRSRIIKINKPNGGVSSARNCGIDAATGEYIGFVDADDYVGSEMYSTLLSAATDNNADIVQCAMVCLEEDGAERVVYSPARDTLIENTDKQGNELFRRLCYGCCSKLYRRSVIGEVRFDSRFPIGEDLLFNLRILDGAKRLFFLTGAMYYYRQREDSATHTALTGERLLSFRNMLKAADAENKSPAIKKYILQCQLSNNTDVISKIILSGSEKYTDAVKEIQRECRRHIGFILFCSALPMRQRLKLVGIGCFFGSYSGLLRRKKGGKDGRK